ncbi:MAG: TetR/AcrR family transcriptional regulator [Ornithinimicrobium sp.]|uniref:TetR/AcrR family transcriptional regulator n=1 Tax=Ornithinimicrobium sp. TaxID=1977084 RepID=UPI003D9B06F1
MTDEPAPLTVLGASTPERVDAARNRATILRAARDLLTEAPGEVSMQDVARRAGVGVGTVYRRFSDRHGLLLAVLDEGEQAFQREFIQGPAPLGPGSAGTADPARRIQAFVHAHLDRTIADLDLRLALDPAGRGSGEPYRTWHLHLRTLCVALGPQRVPDADYWADLLLAALAPGLVRDQLDAGATSEALHAAVDVVVCRLVGDRCDPAAGSLPRMP